MRKGDFDKISVIVVLVTGVERTIRVPDTTSAVTSGQTSRVGQVFSVAGRRTSPTARNNGASGSSEDVEAVVRATGITTNTTVQRHRRSVLRITIRIPSSAVAVADGFAQARGGLVVQTSITSPIEWGFSAESGGGGILVAHGTVLRFGSWSIINTEGVA